MELISEIIRWLIGFILFGAAWAKGFNYGDFKMNLVSSFDFTGRQSSISSISLITVEATLSILLFANLFTYWVMLITLVLFVVITLFVMSFWRRDSSIRCNCFGKSERPVSVWDFFRNGLIIVSTGLYITTGSLNESIDLSGHLLLASTGLLLSIFLINLDDVMMILKS
ncbi:MauE/DoxX family redox-associated membrane protein [Kangiella koreensis]|uniref:Methylamine utilization protein MauE n=1 Tax=Kangiella koreensis (strain DSM 16069 / JCM 12317 / KCTC 12182 / SW-125) TaxID=523791 RepID=C7RCI8_KANKD|nr:MauE/DoxX family redox-associated membrane protein [Kangiella koreensis]ACV26980.1 DoxX family protein [Kangiella koreensis DSM 16069]